MCLMTEAEDIIIGCISDGNKEGTIDIFNKYYTTDALLRNCIKDEIRCRKNNIICLFCCINRFFSSENLNISNFYIDCIDLIENESSLTSIYNIALDRLMEILDEIHSNSQQSNPIVDKAVEYIEENFDEDLTLALISKNLHISKSHLSYLFVKHTGLRLTEYINLTRIDRAKELIVNTNCSMSYISDTCGFKNQSYFSIVFKKFENISPLEYRKRGRI